MPFFSELGKMLSQQGPLSWDAARQVAIMSATGGEAEPNVDPQLRITIEQLARVAELQVSSRTGLSTSVSGSGLKVVPVTRTQWVQTSLEAWRPLFERLAAALADDGEDEPALTDPNDPAGFMAPLMKMVGPMMLGMTAGGLLGQLARRSFGQYDTPVPRSPSDEVLVVPANISAFGDEWSLDSDDLYLWVCLYEVTHHAVMGIPHVRRRLEELLHGYLDGFEADPGAFEQKLEQLDPTAMTDMSGLQDIFSDPEALLGAMRSPQQDALAAPPRRADQHHRGLCGLDHGPDRHVAHRQLPAGHRGGAPSTGRGRSVGPVRRAAVRARAEPVGVRGRRRVRSPDLPACRRRRRGPTLGRPQYLPTPNEIEAPGVWVARVGLSGDLSDSQLDGLGDVEIPDDLSDL